MSASLNAIGIIFVIIVTIFILYKYASKKTTLKRVVLSFLVMLAIFLLHSIFSMTMCSKGNPTTQWIVPTLAIFFILAFVKEQRLRRVTASSLFIVSIALSQHYMYLVKNAGYSGGMSPHFNRYKMHFKHQIESFLKEKARLQEDTNSSINYPAGWIIDMFPKKYTFIASNKLYQPKFDEMWHSNFTFLYNESKGERLEMWYKGGYLRDNYYDVEFRPYKLN